MNKIKDLRFEIDNIDKRLLDLIVERLRIAKEIGKVKKDEGMEIIDRQREKEVFERLAPQARKEGINPVIVEKIWKALMEYSYEIEGDKNGNN